MNVPLLNKLLKQAQQAMILKNLKSSSLASMIHLCDDDCMVVLTKNKLSVIKDKEILLSGTQNRKDDLWDIPIWKRKITPENFQKRQTHPAMYESRKIQNLLKNKLKGNKMTAMIQKIRPLKPHPFFTALHHIDNVLLQRRAHLVCLQDRDNKISQCYRVAALSLKDKKLAVIVKKRKRTRTLPDTYTLLVSCQSIWYGCRP